MARQIADPDKPCGFQPVGTDLSDSGQGLYGAIFQKGDGLGAADNLESARLLQVRSHLGEEFRIGEADGDANADLAFDPPGEVRQRDGRGWHDAASRFR